MKCKGCGIDLQTHDKHALGYTPKEDSNYCQRCFRLIHYGETESLKHHTVNTDDVLRAVQLLEGDILLVVDVSDIESGIFTGIERHLPNRSFILAVTKADLLPKTVSHTKITEQLRKKLREHAIDVKAVCLLGDHGRKGKTELIDLIRRMKLNKLICVGYANAGKSSLLNALTNQNQLSISPYPHTSLDIQKIEWEHGILYDTPGIKIEQSYLDQIPFDELKAYMKQKPMKPVTIQLRSPQSFVLKHVGAVHLEPMGEASVTLYFSGDAPIHRTSSKNYTAYIDKHRTDIPDDARTILYSIKSGKNDLVFRQLGWFCLNGDFKSVSVETNKHDQLIIRKAFI